MTDPVTAHCFEIDRCNQRGGRMLSVVDLLDAGTLTPELTAYALAAIGGGASFMVGASPGGAGKTTVMGALLNLVPPETDLVAADGLSTIFELEASEQRFCCICHEIGRGPYYAYLWGEALRHYFELPAAGHSLATNLHADTLEEAYDQVCRQSGVAEEAFRSMNLVLFLDVRRGPFGTVRTASEVWESDGVQPHRRVLSGGKLSAEESMLVTASVLTAARGKLDRVLSSGARMVEEVRRVILGENSPHAGTEIL